MRRRLLYLLLPLLASGIASCNKQFEEAEKGMGVLCVDMDLDVQTRSSDALYDNALVNIYKADYSGLVRSYRYSQIPSPLYLVADSYRVDVTAGEAAEDVPQAASWTSKSYKGSQEFEIVAGQVTDVTVEAGISNAVSMVSFDPTVAENFSPGYMLSIGLGETAVLEYGAEKSGAEGYFIVDGLIEPALEWTFTGKLAKNGSDFVKSGLIENVQPGKLYKMNLIYTVTDGDLSFSLYVDTVADVYDDTIIFEPTSTGLSASAPYEIWAAHATVHADVDPTDNAGAKVQFSYSSDGTEWSTVDGVNDSEGTWKAVLKGLTPSTEYTYMLLIDGVQVGDAMTFTTDVAPKIPNGSFEHVSLVSGESYYKFYDPSCGVADGMTMFWGSGNGEGSEGVKGSASMGVIITTIDTQNKIDGNQSILAQNAEKLGLLTAGNIFTGQFAELIIGTENGGKVNFGRPWTSRPSALKVYCKYNSGTMDIVNGSPEGVSLVKNQTYDRAQIKVAVGTWDYRTYGGTKASPVQVNTTDKSSFVDFYTDASTIANGDVIIYNDGYVINNGSKVSAATTGWIEYIIPLDYRNEVTYPTHIVVSCATSQFGDYFSGCSSSKLWIDAMELIYE